MVHKTPVMVPHLAWCDQHEKKAFTKQNAKKLVRLLRSRNDSGMRRYPCRVIDSGWHVGHLPLAVMEGRLTVREVYGSE